MNFIRKQPENTAKYIEQLNKLFDEVPEIIEVGMLIIKIETDGECRVEI